MSGVSERLGAISESATLAISGRAAELRSQGRPVIGFGAGEPDFPTPEHVVEAAAAACRDPQNHRYSPAAGLPELRAAIAEQASNSGLEAASKNVVVTAGGKGAVYGTFAALLDPGDEVLLPAPYWVSYPEAAALAGATVAAIPTDVGSGYKVTIDQLEAARTDRTKLLVFVSPSNPTGAVYTPEEVAAIGEWAAAAGIWVMTDEIYDHLVYGDIPFTSLPVVAPAAAERCVVVNGVAKTYAMTGWRVGWAIGPADVVGAMTRLQSHSISNVANVSQRAALAALTGPQDAVAEMRTAFDRRRRVMHEMLSAIPGLECPMPEGAFYAFPSVHGALGRPLGSASPGHSEALAAALLEQAEIAVVPGEAFGAPGHLRFSFALSDEDIVEGLGRWQRLAAESAD